MLYTIQQSLAERHGNQPSSDPRRRQKEKISASKNPQGILEIDAAELHRVYPIVNLETPKLTSVDADDCRLTPKIGN